MQPSDIKERQKYDDAIAAAVDRGESEHDAKRDLVSFIRTGKVAAYTKDGVMWVAPKESRNAANGDN